MIYEIIGTGSKGNAVRLGEHILVDCGLSWKQLSPHTRDLRLILLTHAHGDHLNKKCAAKLAQEHPLIRWACCAWMLPYLADAGVDPYRIDCIAPGQWMDYPGLARIRPQEVPHDVQNCCWHLDINGYRIFYSTDAGHLDDIEAKEYQLYMIEANHTRVDLERRLEEKRARGEYAYELRAAKNHLSVEQANEWLGKNAAEWSKVVYLHQHRD